MSTTAAERTVEQRIRDWHSCCHEYSPDTWTLVLQHLARAQQRILTAAEDTQR